MNSTQSPSVNKATVFTMKNTVDYSKASIVSKTIADTDAGSITLFAFDKSQGLSEHSAPFDALVTVLEGSAEITISGKKHSLKDNQSIIMPANIPHAVHAVDQFKMLLIMIRSK
ncbi:MAG: cupin domain-containing protein [Elusimicrobia bacterium]|nr:cupin domain-containing protein [Elusimicrobiota bacterium]